MSTEELELEIKLDRIRGQATSKLENQKHLALILSVVEDNIKEQKNSLTPTAYFVSFLALLNQSFKDDEVIDQGLATSTAYFLDLVFPFVPKPLLKAKFSDILVKLAPAISSESSEAPLIRSCIGALETLLIAQDAKSWNTKLNVSPWKALNALLQLSLDGRPKIRKRAQEAIRTILINPPPSPTLGHVAGTACSEFALKSIMDLLNTKESKKLNKELNAEVIHNLQLIQSIASSNSWSSSRVEPLCDVLLEISKTNDQYLVSTAFNVFESLFDSLAEPIYTDKFMVILNILFDLKPSINDSHLVGAWVAVIAKAVETYSKLDTIKCISKLPEIFQILITYLGSDNADIYVSASNCIISIVNTSVPDHALLYPPGHAEFQVSGEDFEAVDEAIANIAELVTNLLSVKYAHCAKEVMDILTNLLNKLRFRTNPEFIKPFEIVGQWRTDEESHATLDLKNEEEAVIASAITNLGAEVVLQSLPLNLQNPTNAKPGRAWLLPLLRDNVRHSSLQFYIKNVLPLVEFFEKKISTLDANSMHVKIFQTVVDQIWSLLPHFCDLPNDLTNAFDVAFAEKLSELLYSKVELRTTICHALKLLVESNLTYSEGVLNDDILLTQSFSVEKSKENIEYLSKSMSENILAVLFNVFAQTKPDSRGYILETIEAWLKITPVKILEDNFNKVCTMLKESLEDDEKQGRFQGNNNNQKKGPRLSITMLDLVVTLAKYVPESSYNALFAIFNLTNAVNDNLIQKRSYRIITRLAEVENGKAALFNFITELEQVIIKSTEQALNTAKASRLAAIAKVLEILPKTDLYFIPSITSEIILATKDVNEKTRELAFGILSQMGNIMHEGGIVENGKVPGLDPLTPSVEANLQEYFTIVSAGLGGSSPHMISATITAISCLVYEFLDKLNIEFLQELSGTIDLFLTSNSREIVKSTIGFVKVEVLSLPVELIQPKLKEVLEYLMRWSHEHKGHFKLKVKHIIERMIRRFGYEAIEANMPEEDLKLLANIKKTKQRNKKKQDAAEGEEGAAAAGTGAEAKSGRKFISAYDEVLYDSEDSGDDDDEDDDVDMDNSGRNGSRNKKSKQFIIESGDAPLDLLDKQALAHISSTRPGARGNNAAQKRSLASKFKSRDGKLVFNEEGNITETNDGGAAGDEDLLNNKNNAINAYLDAVKQGPIRGQRNRLKYKRGKTNVEDDDDDADDDNEADRKRGGAQRGANNTRFVTKGSRVGKDNGGRGRGGRGGRGGFRGGRGGRRS